MRFLGMFLAMGAIYPAIAAMAFAQNPPTAGQSGPAAAAFKDLQAQWKDLIGQLGALQRKAQSAPPEDREELKVQWDKLIAKGKQLEPKMIAGAEDAYRESPNADKEVTDFMMAVMESSVNRDDYERAAVLGKLLIDNKGGTKDMFPVEGFVGAMIGDFDIAEKYYDMAVKEDFQKTISEENQFGQKLKNTYDGLKFLKARWEKEDAVRQAEAKANDLPRVLIRTNEGDIEVELFENEAPNTVANFISLVEKKFYDGLTFHRVLPGFVIQGGCPKGDGTGGPGYKIACECYAPNHREHFRGTLSMAHAGKDTGGSQFFICLTPTTHLDGKHTAFGRVVSGLDVLAKIEKRDPEDPNASEPDKIIEMRVLRKRPHEYTVKKM